MLLKLAIYKFPIFEMANIAVISLAKTSKLATPLCYIHNLISA